MPFRVLRGGKRQDVGGVVLAAEARVEFADTLVVGQQDGEGAAVEVDLDEGGGSSGLHQVLDVRKRAAPGVVFSFDVDQIARPLLAASAS